MARKWWQLGVGAACVPRRQMGPRQGPEGTAGGRPQGHPWVDPRADVRYLGLVR